VTKARLAACFALLITLATSAHAREPAPAGGLGGDPFGSGSETDPFAALESVSGSAEPSQDAQAEAGLTLHGYLESRDQIRTGANQAAISTRQRLWLEADGTLLPEGTAGNIGEVRFFASGALDVDPAAADLSDEHDTLRLHAEEVFVTLDSDDLDLVIGRKMLRWGMGDGINPLDLINPLDYRDPIASGRADSRVPVVLGQAIFRLPAVGPLQEATLEAVVIPLAQVDELNAPGSAWEGYALKELRKADAQGQLIFADQQKPDDLWNDAEFGVRLAVTTSGWDLALIGFHGRLDSAVLARDLVLDSNGTAIPRLTPVHPTFSAFGINVAKGLERSTIRGELSLKPDLPMMLRDDKATPGYDRRSVVEGVVGIDRTFGINLYTNLQYYFTSIPDAADLAGESYDHGMTYEIHDLFLQDDLEAGIRGVASFANEGWTFEPYAEYRLGDDWLLGASLLLFEGPEDSRYGQFADNDMLNIRLRYSF